VYRGELRSRLDKNFVNKTPHPILTRLNRLHDRMFGGVKMFGGMFILGRIAAAHMTAFATQAQVHPGITHFQALLAALSVWLHVLELAEVRTFFAHRCPNRPVRQLLPADPRAEKQFLAA